MCIPDVQKKKGKGKLTVFAAFQLQKEDDMIDIAV